jgi:hypothetical protein
MDTDRGMSRRQILRVSAVVASSTVVVGAIGTSAAANPGAEDPANAVSTGKRAQLGRVTNNSDTTRLTVGAPGRANTSIVSSPVAVPYVGFPDHVAPRVGDFVTVTDDWPGVALAAVPVCHWVTGVPKALPNGGFTVGGTTVAPSPLLDGIVGKRALVCVLDTDLPVAQVLATRAG